MSGDPHRVAKRHMLYKNAHWCHWVRHNHQQDIVAWTPRVHRNGWHNRDTQYLSRQRTLHLQANSNSVQVHQKSVAPTDPISIDYLLSSLRDLAPGLQSYFQFPMGDNQSAMHQYTVSAGVDEQAIHFQMAFQGAQEHESAWRHLKRAENVHRYAGVPTGSAQTHDIPV